MELYLLIFTILCVAPYNFAENNNRLAKDTLVFNADKIESGNHFERLLGYFNNIVKENGDLSKDIYTLFESFKKLSNSVVLIDEISSDWAAFKNKFEKVYRDMKTEAMRFVNFLRNTIRIKSHNDKFKDGQVQFKMAINQLSDLSDIEYSNLLGLKMTKRKPNALGLTYLSPLIKVDLPEYVDWRNVSVTPVKDQGKCGSCWAFSTTGSLEGQHFRKTKKLVSLSEQQLVDCSMENFGCGGGLMDQAFQYIQKNGGIDTEESYPYVSGTIGHREKTCNFSTKSIGATVSGFIDIPSGREDKLQEAVALVGPISVGIDASSFSFRNYHSGVYDEPLCNSDNLDHGVLLVGYGVDKETRVPYWLVKNSWNTTWGDEGYIKMRRNAKNMCGIATAASYPLV